MDNLKIDAFCTLGREPESKYTPAGKMVTDVSAAVETGSGDYKKTEWVKLTIWGEKFGELFAGMTKKGTYVWISGVPKIESWKDKEGETKTQLNVNVKDFRILRNGKPRGDEDQTNPYADEEEVQQGE